MKTTTYAAAVLLAALQAANAHIVMQLPVPFPLTRHKSPLNSSSWPCHRDMGPFDFIAAASIKAGDSTLFTFSNMDAEDGTAAVHGGGSCQFAIAKKDACSNHKDWKVLKTVIGGCPGTSEGNLQAGFKQCSGPDTDEVGCLKSYNIQIPKEIEDGQYVLAWTWFNRLGNREMYMQCSPITVTGGGGDADYLDHLPSIFMANIAGVTECSTNEEKGVLGIPNPGLNVDFSMHPLEMVGDAVLGGCKSLYGNARTAPNFPVKGENGGALNYPPGYGSSGASAPAQGGGSGGGRDDGQYRPSPPSTHVNASPSSSSSMIEISSASLHTGEITATSYITKYVTVTADMSSIASSPESTPTSAEPQPQPVNTPVQPPIPNAGSGSCAAGKLPCSEEGQLVCISETQSGLCNHGCMIPQAVAAGTVCKDGTIQHANAKRSPGEHVDAVRYHHHGRKHR